ncbi:MULTISPECIES: hypothetical protein [Streptomyces]|uniref:WXG100 family type VII secretion target n=1 Tax=Streptomyces cacaoi TaxID=1898 RepID=A0A4Y3QUZ7_STRCI|nr:MULTISPECIES: hypothetical protein [Streptomyces]NNG88952.1 hypothetical protein [Streptomyces cacaoi]QHF95311.1 hypothetical protein DEH18_17195 [Streptomyces sp. NHF165]GEB49165.1 hypothetical protein SCA03_17160 [Streptomyces cacaoi]
MASDYMAADTDGMSRNGAKYRELADSAARLVAHHSSATDALGTPWGQGDDMARAFAEIYHPAQERFHGLLENLRTAFQQSTDTILTTADVLARTEQDNAAATRRLHGGR